MCGFIFEMKLLEFVYVYECAGILVNYMAYVYFLLYIFPAFVYLNMH